MGILASRPNRSQVKPSVVFLVALTESWAWVLAPYVSQAHASNRAVTPLRACPGGPGFKLDDGGRKRTDWKFPESGPISPLISAPERQARHGATSQGLPSQRNGKKIVASSVAYVFYTPITRPRWDSRRDDPSATTRRADLPRRQAAVALCGQACATRGIHVASSETDTPRALPPSSWPWLPFPGHLFAWDVGDRPHYRGASRS